MLPHYFWGFKSSNLQETLGPYITQKYEFVANLEKNANNLQIMSHEPVKFPQLVEAKATSKV